MMLVPSRRHVPCLRPSVWISAGIRFRNKLLTEHTHARRARPKLFRVFRSRKSIAATAQQIALIRILARWLSESVIVWEEELTHSQEMSDRERPKIVKRALLKLRKVFKAMTARKQGGHGGFESLDCVGVGGSGRSRAVAERLSISFGQPNPCRCAIWQGRRPRISSPLSSSTPLTQSLTGLRCYNSFIS